MTLDEVLDDAATVEGVPGARADDGSEQWSGTTGPFAILAADGRTVEFRLDPVLADAARRTPDTSGSDRGEAWVSFTPLVVDDHAADRATAWFHAAARRSAG